MLDFGGVSGRKAMQLFTSGFGTQQMILGGAIKKSSELWHILLIVDSKTAQVQTYKVVPTEEMNTALWHSVRFAQKEFSPPKIVVTWIRIWYGWTFMKCMGGAEIPKMYTTIGSHNQDNFEHFFAGLDLRLYCDQNRGGFHPFKKMLEFRVWGNLLCLKTTLKGLGRITWLSIAGPVFRSFLSLDVSQPIMPKPSDKTVTLRFLRFILACAWTN